jgi:hypothetical protein
MRSPRLKYLLHGVLGLLLFATPTLAANDTADETWQDVPREQIDDKALTPRGKKVLALDGVDWKHAQTPHFAIHYEQAIFARKVARMAEFFYDYIAQDLQGAKDRVDGRSHIFVFRSEKRWKEFLDAFPDVPEWTFSQVAGTVMYLQQAESVTSSGEVLAHEMTHLVVNRFLGNQPPLWLNEGLAEYYATFAYSAYKGTKKSKRAQFVRLTRPYPVGLLLYANTYPHDPDEVSAFYETAKYMLGWLLLDQPSQSFFPFLESMAAGDEPVAAFSKHYGLKSVNDIEKEFRKFAY